METRGSEICAETGARRRDDLIRPSSLVPGPGDHGLDTCAIIRNGGEPIG